MKPRWSVETVWDSVCKQSVDRVRGCFSCVIMNDPEKRITKNFYFSKWHKQNLIKVCPWNLRLVVHHSTVLHTGKTVRWGIRKPMWQINREWSWETRPIVWNVCCIYSSGRRLHRNITLRWVVILKLKNNGKMGDADIHCMVLWKQVVGVQFIIVTLDADQNFQLHEKYFKHGQKKYFSNYFQL